jgi:hypothetical protein
VPRRRSPPPELIALCRTLARLTHPRLRSQERLRQAHALLRATASELEIADEEEWADSVLLLFLRG